MSVILETSLGDIVVDLYIKERPICSENFLKLCKSKYYNFCMFHSVQKNLVAQTGDPTATGKGGESIFAKLYGEQAAFFDAEVKPRIKHEKLGQLSMVNNGDGKHGSQFFVTLAEDIDYLDGKHTVFGEVAEGHDVLDKINGCYVDDSHVPYKDIRIYHTVVLEDPFKDSEEMKALIPATSPRPTLNQLQNGRIGVDEKLDDTEGLTADEVQEYIADREAKANAQILEMVGDLPDAEVRPPDNILFVCKLNPVTTSEDLEIIFSRFGEIVECEIIRDYKTDESLQYAFIEFEEEKSCEQAYFKMDNVLIDDRRIHVDFSQSVAKQWHKKGSQPYEESDGRNNYKLKEQKKRYDKYEYVFENDDKSLMDQQEKTISERKQRKLDLKTKEKEELIRQEADEKEMRELQDKRDQRKIEAREKRKQREESPSRSYREPERYRRQRDNSRSPLRRQKSPPERRGEQSPKFRRHKSPVQRREKSRERKHRRQYRSPDRREKSSKMNRYESPKKSRKTSKYRSKSPKHRSNSPESRKKKIRRSLSESSRSRSRTPIRRHKSSKRRSISPENRKMSSKRGETSRKMRQSSSESRSRSRSPIRKHKSSKRRSISPENRKMSSKRGLRKMRKSSSESRSRSRSPIRKHRSSKRRSISPYERSSKQEKRRYR